MCANCDYALEKCRACEYVFCTDCFQPLGVKYDLKTDEEIEEYWSSDKHQFHLKSECHIIIKSNDVSVCDGCVPRLEHYAKCPLDECECFNTGYEELGEFFTDDEDSDSDGE